MSTLFSEVRPFAFAVLLGTGCEVLAPLDPLRRGGESNRGGDETSDDRDASIRGSNESGSPDDDATMDRPESNDTSFESDGRRPPTTDRDGPGESDAADARSDRTDADEITAPRLVGPLSTSTTTSQRPTFRVALADGTDGAVIEICSDAGCASPLTTMTTTVDHAKPFAPLSRGHYFWRARGRRGNATGAQVSATWSFGVGARNAFVDTSWGTSGGPVRLFVTDPTSFAPAIYWYDSSGSSVPTEASGHVDLPSAPLVGVPTEPVANAGDIDGDGVADLVAGTGSANDNSGRAVVYMSRPDGASPLKVELSPPTGSLPAFGGTVAGAGDLNGDGYADIVIGTDMDPKTNAGQGHVYLGGPSGPQPLPWVTLTAVDGLPGAADDRGRAVAATVGDVNGDGYGDVVIGSTLLGTSGYTGGVYSGRALVYAGGVAMSPRPTWSLSTIGSSRFGVAVAGAGDMNGDGYADILVAMGPNNGKAVYLYLGGPYGVSSPAAAYAAPESLYDVSALAGVGDLDGDGFGDIAIGSRDTVYVYFGSVSPGTNDRRTVLTCPDASEDPFAQFGQEVAGPGDFDGDGYADLVVAAPSFRDTGRVYVFLGSSFGLMASTPSRLFLPNRPAGNFGASLAAATVPKIGVDARGHRSCRL